VAIEKPKYQIIIQDGSFEIRQYEPLLRTVSRETDLRGGSGFNAIFNYISGYNQSNTKISMTSPVINTIEDKDQTIAFVMPSVFTSSSIPKPNDPNLHIESVPERLVATIGFSGNVERRRLDILKDDLNGWLKKQSYISIGSFELARYNPPFIPGFLKHNELMIEVMKPSSQEVLR